jgi:hypothetical protein
MNQILLNVLAQDPAKTPGICLSFRWLLPLIPHLEILSGWFIFPILGTWLGCLFLDTADLWDQVFSLTGLLYVSTIVSMIPKPNTSSKLWFDANLFTVVCYSVYFTELALIAFFNLDLEYSISWLFDIVFSTACTFIFYGILLGFRLSTPQYFKTIVSIYLLTDLGNMIALGTITPFDTDKIFVTISMALFVYLMLPFRHPLLFSKVWVSPFQLTENLMILRCFLWGAVSVWADYIALTPFYLLEMVLASDSHQRKDSVLYYCKGWWSTYKFKMWENIREIASTLAQSRVHLLSFVHKQKTSFRWQLAGFPVLTSHMNHRLTLFSRNL